MLDTLVSVPNAVIIDYLKMFLEIFILTVVIYKTLHYLRGARGASVLAGITILLLVLTLLSKKLNLDVLNWLLTGIWGTLGAAVVIIVAAVVGIVLPMLPKAQAQIELSYPPENAYMMKEDDGFVGWMIHFYSTNVSDVPFTPAYAQAKWYEGDKLNGSSPAIDYEYMRNWMESEALVKGEMPLDLYCGTDKLNVDRGVFIISGTDANGHELKFSISIDLIHEFPPESEN